MRAENEPNMSIGYYAMLAKAPENRVGENFAQAYLAAQAGKRQQQQLDAEKAQREASQAEKQEAKDLRSDYVIAQREAEAGRPDVMQNYQQMYPAQFQGEQAAEMGAQTSRMNLVEDRQKIRDKLLEQGLTAASANPANWPKFVQYAERSQMFEPGELDQNMTAEQAAQGVGRFKSQSAARAGKDIAGDLRKEFQGNQTYKDMQQVAAAYRKITGTSETGAGDMSMIFAYMKMLDPGSTVREGEYATAQNVGSVPQNIVGMYNRAINGQKLDPGVRAQFKQEAGSVFHAQKGRYDALANQYGRLATNAGVNSADVVLDIGLGTSARADQRKLNQAQEKQLVDLVQSGKSVDDALREMGFQ